LYLLKCFKRARFHVLLAGGPLSHSCQVHQKKGRDKVGNKCNMREARAKISGSHPLLGDHTHFGVDHALPRPLNIEIYGPKFDSILSLCLCHTPIFCNRKKFRDISTILCQPGHNRDIGQKIGTLGNYAIQSAVIPSVMHGRQIHCT
jgi:hypothetical protein